MLALSSHGQEELEKCAKENGNIQTDENQHRRQEQREAQARLCEKTEWSRNTLRNGVSEIIEELYFSPKPSQFLLPLKKAAEESQQRAVIKEQRHWCRTDSMRDTREKKEEERAGKERIFMETGRRWTCKAADQADCFLWSD